MQNQRSEFRVNHLDPRHWFLCSLFIKNSHSYCFFEFTSDKSYGFKLLPSYFTLFILFMCFVNSMSFSFSQHYPPAGKDVWYPLDFTCIKYPVPEVPSRTAFHNRIPQLKPNFAFHRVFFSLLSQMSFDESFLKFVCLGKKEEYSFCRRPQFTASPVTSNHQPSVRHHR
jgi:hypothetical protein